MSGDKPIHLPYLCGALWRASFTGKLVLLEGADERVLFLLQGKVVHVQSRLQEETLGRLLLDAGKLNQAQYDVLLDRLVTTRKPAGELLVQLGFLGPQEVFGALEFQTGKKLGRTFRMKSFGFQLEPGEVPVHLQIARFELPEAILAGLQAHYPADRIMDEFPVDEETVFTSVPLQPLGVALGPRESRVMRSVQAGAPLARLMAGGADLRQLLAILYGLHALWLVEASGVSRPALGDLELAGLPVEPELEPALPPPPTASEEPELPEEIELDLDGDFKPPTLVSILEGRIEPRLAEKALSLARTDHFKLLGLPRIAPAVEVKNAYERLLKAFKLQDIDQAYTSDKERELARRLLDQATLAYRELSDPVAHAAYLEALERQLDPASREVAPRVLADVQAQKGLLAVTARRWEEARALLEEAIRIYPQEPSYHFHLGRTNYLQALERLPAKEKLPESLRAPFLKAMAMNTHYAEPRLYLGYISKRNGELQRALQEFEAALDCDPHNRLAQSEARLLQRRLQAGPPRV
jgi:tetratricopeptide (TPR) repeat protein